MGDNLPAITDRNFTSKMLARIQKWATEAAAGFTGIFASERKDLVLSGGRLFQGLINLELIDTLLREWNDFREKSRIKDDYQQTEQHHACLQQMLDFMDNDKPDKTRFEFMKKIFLSAATESIEDRESVLPQQYMYIARQLTSGDILLLKGVFEMHTNKAFSTKDVDANLWLTETAKYCGLEHTMLVEFHEKHLAELGLLTEKLVPRPDHPELAQVRPGATNRLTDLGLALCEFLQGYDG